MDIVVNLPDELQSIIFYYLGSNESNLIKKIDWKYEMKNKLQKSIYFKHMLKFDDCMYDKHNYFSNVYGDVLFNNISKKYEFFHSRMDRIEIMDKMDIDCFKRSIYENLLFDYLEDFK